VYGIGPQNTDPKKPKLTPEQREHRIIMAIRGEDYINYDKDEKVKFAIEDLDNLKEYCGNEAKVCIGRLFMMRFEFVIKYEYESGNLQASFLENTYHFNKLD